MKTLTWERDSYGEWTGTTKPKRKGPVPTPEVPLPDLFKTPDPEYHAKAVYKPELEGWIVMASREGECIFTGEFPSREYACNAAQLAVDRSERMRLP